MKSIQNVVSNRICFITALTVIFLFAVSSEVKAQVRITDGSVLTMDINSLLELESTSRGLLIPRVAINNLTQATPLTAPVPIGMMVYSLGGAVLDGFYYWNGAVWSLVGSGAASQWTTIGSDIYYNIGNIGVGTTTPAERMAVNGNLKIGSTTTGTIRSTNELVLRQDGDIYGPSILRLRNRTNENGAIFETTDATHTLVDFIFKNAENQRNIRFESRVTYARTGAPSFHLGGASPDNPTLSLGDNYAAFNKNVRIGDYTTPLTALDVNGQITLRTGASTGAVLVSDVNGTGSWKSIGGVSEIPLAKSVSATLLKTETFVLASGDITLTLPVVTATDNGLTITVKNIGTYLNLVTVAGNSGATIDGNANANLTRWRGQTYIAWNGNWIQKNKETQTDNLLEVSTGGSFTTIAEVVGFLNLHMSGPAVVRLGVGTHQISATQTINLTYPVTFEGLSYGETTIEADAGASGAPLFNCETECYFKMLSFTALSNATGNDGLRFNGSGTYNEVKDCYFLGFNKGIVSTNNNELWVFESDFENCAGAGLEIAAGVTSGGSLKISECDFIQCAKGINLLSGVSETISIMNCTFYNTILGTDIGILYTPGSFTSFASIFISNNAYNNQGIFESGFDFSLASGRDANVFLVNNSGIHDENPHCKINVNNNVTTTTVPTSGTYYKANWTNAASSYTSKWTLVNNRITYQPINKADAWSMITGNISVNNSNRIITIAIVRNGVTTTRFGETDLRVTVANQPFQFSTVIYIPDMAKNDYLELYVTSGNSADVITFQDVQWFTNAK